MTINEIQDEIIEDFELTDDWMERYEMIIEMGNDLPPFLTRRRLPSISSRGVRAASG